jgi:hypothetical protein
MKLQVCVIGEKEEEILRVDVVGTLQKDGFANRISIL